jgi:phospholipid-binding lipoprotein MlaA
MKPQRAGPVVAVLAGLLANCATTGERTPGDPLEGMNRRVQRFNDAVDRAVLRPVARGYERHVPRVIRTGIGNVLDNLSFTTTIVNDFLQLKLVDTFADIGRFAINSTLGLGGLLDPATRIGIRHNEEDFGQTLGRWGVKPGPYLVLPLVGPSSLRDGPALLADAQTDLRVQLDLEPEVRAGLAVLTVVDGRAALLPLDPAIDAAFDRYAFMRNAWLQRRQYQVKDGDVPEDAPLEEELEDPGDQTPAEPAAPATPGESATPEESSKSETPPIPASADSAGGRLR